MHEISVNVIIRRRVDCGVERRISVPRAQHWLHPTHCALGNEANGRVRVGIRFSIRATSGISTTEPEYEYSQ